jgi:hypothetical protein
MLGFDVAQVVEFYTCKWGNVKSGVAGISHNWRHAVPVKNEKRNLH